MCFMPALTLIAFCYQHVRALSIFYTWSLVLTKIFQDMFEDNILFRTDPITFLSTTIWLCLIESYIVQFLSKR